MMLRTAIAFFALAVVLPAATVRLYLKDGTYHNVREYQKQADRVRYYSTERSDWEEIPLELVDLKRTEQEISAHDKERHEQAKLIDDEEKAERAAKRIIESIPYAAGVFQLEGDKPITLKSAESKVVTNKRRSVLKAMSPIPIVSGKATVEIDGITSPMKLPAGEPEFYIRLSADERFVIARLERTKTSRIVQHWDIIPVTKEVMDKTDEVEIFRQQLADGLYKIWPTKPMEPGEYAVVEYTEGKGNPQVWDFTLSPGSTPVSQSKP